MRFNPFVPSTYTPQKGSEGPQSSRVTAEGLPIEWVDQLCAFLSKSFKNFQRNTPSVTDDSVATHTLTSLISLFLDFLPSTLSSSPQLLDIRMRILKEFSTYFLSVDAASFGKMECLRVVEWMMDFLEKRFWERKGKSTHRDGGEEERKEEEFALFWSWISLLPKVLYQCAVTDPYCPTIHHLVCILSRVVSRTSFPSMEDDENEKDFVTSSFSLYDPTSVADLQSSLVPLLFVRSAKVGDVYGPFLFLPTSLQLSIVHLIHYFPKLEESMLRAIAAVIGHSGSVVLAD